MIKRPEIAHKPKLSKITIIITAILMLYIIAIASPTFFLYLRIMELGELRHSNCYAINNSTSPLESNTAQSKKLFQYLTSSEIKIYTMFSYIASINNSAKIPVTQSYANEAFFELYNFDFVEGKSFEKSAFSCDAMDIIPIIVGHNAQELYQYGQTYSVKAFGSSKLFKARVIGVLKENSNYVAHWLHNINLDDTYIIPITEDFSENYFTFPDYDMFFSRMLIQTNEPEIVANKINEFDSLRLKLVSLDDMISNRMNSFISTFVNRLLIGLIVFVAGLTLILIKRKYIFQAKAIGKDD